MGETRGKENKSSISARLEPRTSGLTFVNTELCHVILEQIFNFDLLAGNPSERYISGA